MHTHALICFLGASVALTVAPGPDNLFVIAQAIARGRRAALATAWGMCSGILVHTTAAALGISAVFRSSPIAFRVVKYAGAAYLLYLAVRYLGEGSLQRHPSSGMQGSTKAMFRRGFLMNVLNPKVGLFFLAFLPQFAVPGQGSMPGQMGLLGLLFMVQAMILFTILALSAGTVGQYLLRSPRWARWLNRIAAAVFLALALRLILAEG